MSRRIFLIGNSKLEVVLFENGLLGDRSLQCLQSTAAEVLTDAVGILGALGNIAQRIGEMSREELLAKLL